MNRLTRDQPPQKVAARFVTEKTTGPITKRLVDTRKNIPSHSPCQTPVTTPRCFERGRITRHRVTLTVNYFPEGERHSEHFCRCCFDRLGGWVGAERARLQEEAA